MERKGLLNSENRDIKHGKEIHRLLEAVPEPEDVAAVWLQNQEGVCTMERTLAAVICS